MDHDEVLEACQKMLIAWMKRRFGPEKRRMAAMARTVALLRMTRRIILENDPTPEDLRALADMEDLYRQNQEPSKPTT